jgi:non-canonical (house-cleaning) NTP pyrophosphatase
MLIAIGTTSEINITGVAETLKELAFDAQVLPLNIGLEEQTFGFDQLTEGARKKAQQALELQKADMGIGIENGLVQIGASGWFDFVCVVALAQENKESIGFGVGFFIPDWVVSEIKEKNTKLSTIIDRLSEGKDKDPLQYFSNHTLTREEALKRTLVGALSKIINHDRYHL